MMKTGTYTDGRTYLDILVNVFKAHFFSFIADAKDKIPGNCPHREQCVMSASLWLDRKIIGTYGWTDAWMPNTSDIVGKINCCGLAVSRAAFFSKMRDRFT